jgi:hypothetical protein
MGSNLTRTLITFSLLIALAGSALAIYVPQAGGRVPDDSAAINAPTPQPDDSAQAPARPSAQRVRYASPPPPQDRPARRHHRSFAKRVLIVAGAAGTAAAIGALAGGGRGAAIGALAGGAGGFLYDHLTAH